MKIKRYRNGRLVTIEEEVPGTGYSKANKQRVKENIAERLRQRTEKGCGCGRKKK